MKFYYLKYIVLCGLLFTSHFSYSQYKNNATELIKKNKVKSLIVWTDSLKNGCPIDLFEYDKNGNVIIYHFGITLDETSYRYDSKNRLTDLYNYWEEFDPHIIDTNRHVTLHYDKKGKFEYTSTFYYHDSSTVIDSIYPIENKILNEAIYKNKQLYSHVVDTFYQPCLGEWTGKHRIEYFYFKNGLIRKIRIIPLTSVGRKAEWFFEYEY